MTFFGDILIGGAAFAAGWYGKPYIEAVWSWLKAVWSWLKAKI